MTDSDNQTLGFQCPKCGKQMKVGASIAGRRVKCPQCAHVVRLPGVPGLDAVKPESLAGSENATAQTAAAIPPAGSLVDDLWPSLNEPAIGDVQERQQRIAETKAKKAAENAGKHRIRKPSAASGQQVPVSQQKPMNASGSKDHGSAGDAGAARGGSLFDADDEFTIAPLEARGNSDGKKSSSVPGIGGTAPAARPAGERSRPPQQKSSVFDDDLPELADLSTLPTRPTQAISSIDELGDLDGLIPELMDAPDSRAGRKTASDNLAAAFGNMPGLLDERDGDNGEYRITCTTCGTPQYVPLAAKGTKIRCPDCYSEFKVPPPPAGWSTKKKKMQLSGEDMPLAPSVMQNVQREEADKRHRTEAMLAKAKREMTDEDMERLYDGDFDTAGFVRRTFGFLGDPIAVSFVIGYGVVFACVFAVAQWSLNKQDDPDYGQLGLLLGVVGAPLLGFLFGLPMFSSALALLESVANGQKRVTDWPGFDMFENFGDIMAIAVAFLGAVVPGFMLGMWLGGDDFASTSIHIGCVMASTFILFPILLLSILDNGSMFQPISGSVLASFSKATEAWGGYLMKTLVVFCIVSLAWMMLLGEGRSPLLAAIAGFLLAPLVFFTFQQLGSLAEDIGSHLSFEFTPKSDASAEGADAGAG